MKQTAVEWLEKELNYIEENAYTSYIDLKIKQALEMEKEQMINYHKHLIEKFTKLEYTFNTDVKLILDNYKNTQQ